MIETMERFVDRYLRENETRRQRALKDAERGWGEWVGDSITQYDEIAKAAYITGFMHSEGWFEW